MGGGASSQAKFASKYILAGELGKGAFSVVRLGVDKASGQKRAIKIVNKRELNAEDMASLKEEIAILSTIDHKNIIKLYEHFDEGTDMFLVTELVEGGELFDRIVAKASYTEKEARDVIKVVLETIAALHDMDLVHRALKPENLLLCGGASCAHAAAASPLSSRRVAKTHTPSSSLPASAIYLPTHPSL